MKEPHISSTVYDMTGGLQPAPSDDGYNIAMVVYSPTGPTTKTKVLSQKDFIDKYMVGTSMSPTDDISTIMAYMTLAQNPLYVVRACPETVLEGVGCTGIHYLFDKNKHILNDYWQFEVTNITDSGTCYGLGKSDSAKELYYAGTSTTGTHDVSATKDLDKLCAGLVKDTQSNGDLKIVSVTPQNKIVATEELFFTDNVAVLKSIEQKDALQTVTADASVEVSQGSNVVINGKTYYYRGDNTVDPSEFLNPVAINSAAGQQSIDSVVFLSLVQQKASYDYLAQNVVIGLKDGSSTLTITQGDNVFGAADTFAFNPADKSEIGNARLESGAADFFTAATSGATVTFNTDNDVTSATIDSDKILTKPVIIKNDTINHSLIFLGEEDDQLYFYCVSLNEDSGSYTVANKQKIKVANQYAISMAVFSTWAKLANTLGFSHTGSYALQIPSYINVVCNAGTALVLSKSDSYTYFLASNSDNLSLVKHDSLYLQIDNVLYFTNKEVGLPNDLVADAETIVQMASTPVNKTEFMSLLEQYVYQTQKINTVAGAFVSTSLLSSVSIHSSELVVGNITHIEQKSFAEQFAIVQNFPSTLASFQYAYSLDEDSVDTMGSIYNLTLKVKGGEIVENWTMSFDSGKVDGYGVDQWYTRVQSDYFTVVNLQPENVKGEILDSFTSDVWGNAVELPAFDTQFAIDALQKLIDVDDGVKYDVISDGGITDTTLASACEALAIELNAVYPASLPATELSVSSLKSYVGAADLKSYETRLLAAGDRINVAGFSVPLAGSYKLILQLINMFRNKGSEFAPNFNIQNGSVGVSNLIQRWEKSERESLLDARIETLKGGINTDWYINKNITAQKALSYLSEEQNVRMTNTAIHVVENACVQYIGQLNTAALRAKVEDRMNMVLQERLFNNKVETPAYYYAVCNDTNNTTATINANQLIISLYASFNPSVQDILIKNIIQPLDNAQ